MEAQCRWWVHPENVGCSNDDGDACTCSGVAAVKAHCKPTSCDSECQTWKEPGKCFTKTGCSGAECDANEFFHKVYFDHIGENLYLGYDKKNTNVTQKMNETAACKEVLQAMNNASYKLPKKKFNEYLPTTITQPLLNDTWKEAMKLCEMMSETGAAVGLHTMHYVVFATLLVMA